MEMPQQMPPVALTIAGSDPSGGAGIQADLKTFHQFGVYGEAVITLLTVQNTVSLEYFESVPAVLVVDQLRAVLDDIAACAAKTGAVGERKSLTGVAVDVLFTTGFTREFRASRIESAHTHGTGCTYSAAITAELAQGALLEHAVAHAKAFITEAIRTAPGLGRGSGPVNHHASV